MLKEKIIQAALIGTNKKALALQDFPEALVTDIDLIFSKYQNNEAKLLLFLPWCLMASRLPKKYQKNLYL